MIEPHDRIAYKLERREFERNWGAILIASIVIGVLVAVTVAAVVTIICASLP